MRKTVKQTVLGAAFVLAAGMAQAAITVDDVVATYQGGGYSWVEVKEGPNQIKVEAMKDGVVLQVVYDKASGQVVKSEQHTATAAESTRTGIEVRSKAGRKRHANGADHGANHDLNDDHGSDDDASDDESSDDDSNDHNSSDHGGANGHGRDHGGADDQGDDHGDDDGDGDHGRGHGGDHGGDHGGGHDSDHGDDQDGDDGDDASDEDN